MDRYITDSVENRAVKLIQKSLEGRTNEEKEQQNRQNNIIIFELPESKKANTDDRKKILKNMGLCKKYLQSKHHRRKFEKKQLDWEKPQMTKKDHC